MKTKVYSALILLIIFAGGCTIPNYLPQSREVDVNQQGSYIKITPIQGANVKGELLAVDTTNMIVLVDTNEQKIVKFVPLIEVKDFTLRYARSKKYWWTILAYTALCASHGWYAIITAPLNLIVTSAVSLTSANDFTYSMDDISYVQLKMFARFPGGIPSNIILSGDKMNIR